MAKIIASLVFGEYLGRKPTNVRFALALRETAKAGLPNVRVSLTYKETLKGGLAPNIRLTAALREVAKGGLAPNVRIGFLMRETLIPVPPEEYMSNDTFPGFGNSTANPSLPAASDPARTSVPGLSIEVHRKPLYKTAITTSSSGYEVRNAQMEWPIWEYELVYEFLEDRTGADSSLKTLLGFFLQMRGMYDTWLFKDPDDYQADQSTMIPYDSSDTVFYACRSFGGFVEPVGQIDTSNNILIREEVSETLAIPAGDTGPYTVTVSQAAKFWEPVSVTVNGVTMTKTTGAPLAGQYSLSGGTFTFNAAQKGGSAIIDYIWTMDPTSDYNVQMPNRIAFSVQPVGTPRISCQFYFVCRFNDDQQDYDKFYDKLWELQECNFRSVLQ